MSRRFSRTRMGWVLVAAPLAMVAAAAAPPADAQVRATVVTTTGERHEGTNLGFRIDEGEVAVRTGPDTEPRVPIRQVALIEFAAPADPPPPEVIEQERGGDHLLVKRDGTLLGGQLIEAGHEDPADESTPYIVTFEAQGEEHRLDVAEVSQIVLGDVPAEAAAPDEPGREIVVSGRDRWTETGVTVQAGEMVAFEASGEIRLSDAPDDVAGPAGARSGRLAPGSPIGDALAGALIGRIDDGEPFAIGDQRTVEMPGSGELFLGVNDDSLGDNEGEFTVRVEPGG